MELLAVKMIDFVLLVCLAGGILGSFMRFSEKKTAADLRVAVACERVAAALEARK